MQGPPAVGKQTLSGTVWTLAHITFKDVTTGSSVTSQGTFQTKSSPTCGAFELLLSMNSHVVLQHGGSDVIVDCLGKHSFGKLFVQQAEGRSLETEPHAFHVPVWDSSDSWNVSHYQDCRCIPVLDSDNAQSHCLLSWPWWIAVALFVAANMIRKNASSELSFSLCLLLSIFWKCWIQRIQVIQRIWVILQDFTWDLEASNAVVMIEDQAGSQVLR